MTVKLAVPKWREKIRNYKDITEQHKADFIEGVMSCGRMTTAAEKLDIGYTQIRTARKNDPEFDDAVEYAMAVYHDRNIADIEHAAVKGTERTSYNKDGDVVKSETVYESNLRLAYLKAHDKKNYTPQQQIDITTGGKPLGIVPATADENEWEALAASLNDKAASEADFEE